MYSDQINGGAGTNRKRSVRDRLGNSSDQQASANRPQANSKRQRLEEGGKWKHDLYEEKELVGIRQPNGQDLRLRLGRKNVVRGGQQHVEAGSTGGIKDLREKLSGPVPPTQLTREIAANQRRLASVVRGSAGIASLANVRPGASRNVNLSHKLTPLSHKPSVLPKPHPEVDENSIAGLLQSLGLSKYLITFQAEEVDMAALQHMGDDDLKELGVPMGPRKKILLAVGGRS
ncbi:hypothetical protein MPTK1_3g01540 [Marchantia polymorpha subsp. ruderalis]|nr:hypothetical protein AXG93_4012s1120 [Marchantia polymorpha subsp. ruderalis]PTQ47747.1 hypothetical protein MARPO_0007s0146 [Marchantia polymorpha]BBN04060.1 hypothetical protein Mp_3g01540 [Marchantia polymorpha subsp. ruderalis]|eukprot:PTQ47747.1 hypothetical protein MARPO_0007s0146 [Marchantia polymorpha]